MSLFSFSFCSLKNLLGVLFSNAIKFLSLTFSLMYFKTFWHLFCGLLQDGFQILFWPHLCLWASALSQLNDLLFFGETFILQWYFHFASLTMSGFVLNTQTFRSAALTFPGLSKRCFSVVRGFLLGFLLFQLYLLFF